MKFTGQVLVVLLDLGVILGGLLACLGIAAAFVEYFG